MARTTHPLSVSVLCLALLALPRLLSADEPAAKAPPASPAETPEVISITASPARSPLPALKHRLVFETLELRPGNAAIIYLKAMLVNPAANHPDTLKLNEKVSEWVDQPFEKLPREEVRKLLARYTTVLEQIDIAVHRERCDWEIPLRETDNPFGILLPELQELRNYSRVLLLKARLEMAEGKHEQALGTLRTGLAMGRHAAGPTLVNGLVGIAISNIMLKELATWVNRPNAPSLYWATTTVPHPWIDLNPATELDVNSMYLLFPGLHGAATKKLSDDQWKVLHGSVLQKLARMQRDFEAMKIEGEPFNVATRMAKSLAALNGSRKTLARYGYADADLAEMPVEKLSLLHDIHVYEEARDAMLWWFSVPYSKLSLAGSDAKRWEHLPGTIVLPDPKLLLPAVQQSRRAEARLERHFALLRLVEALRLHAGANDGKLPARLADITIVPVSDNPFTGEPFGYRIEEETAVIDAAGQAPMQIRLKMRAAK
jgi:hypothetical protein